MKSKSNTKKNDFSGNLLDLCTEILLSSFTIFIEGLKSKKIKKIENIFLLFSVLLVISFNIINENHLTLLQDLFGDFLVNKYYLFFIDKPVLFELVPWLMMILGIYISLFGIPRVLIKRKYQKGIDRLRLKSGLDEKPKIIDVNHLNENRTKLLVKSAGLGQERYQSKLDDLRASVGQRVESVRYFNKDNTFVEIYLAKKPLEKIVYYKDVIGKLNKPYSFIPGKALNGLITQSIVDLPHLMIGGTTGGGKSVTLNNTLLNLLESSDNLQMYLIDLKSGLEVKSYESLPNVKLVKDVVDANMILKRVVDEMDRRYKYLEEKGHKKIDPKRDKLNRIIIAIDECTDLLGNVGKAHPDYHLIKDSIYYLDTLARKARASGIHLILATQKIDKSSIPTRIQENISGRIALRVKTVENSVRMLGNKKASELPKIAGRAIWAEKEEIEVQVPFISEEEINLRIEKIRNQIKDGTKKMFKYSIEEEIPNFEKGNHTIGYTKELYIDS